MICSPVAFSSPTDYFSFWESWLSVSGSEIRGRHRLVSGLLPNDAQTGSCVRIADQLLASMGCLADHATNNPDHCSEISRRMREDARPSVPSMLRTGGASGLTMSFNKVVTAKQPSTGDHSLL
jgi:hypothetical protein